MATSIKTKGLPSEPVKPHDSSSKSRSTPGGSGAVRPSAMRETIESVVVAFILAFLFKTFEAEAFVIPTGSMAPTLLGRNKDAVCPKCGTHFTIGASDEVESETDYVIPGSRITSAVCPNCRYRVGEDRMYNVPVFKGDRILVTKFSFEIRDPERFDVVVFKYPEEPKINYIKRCIGLPNETLEIRQGDVYRISDRGAEILRKADPNKQRALQLPVYDNDHPERPLLEAGWPERWASVKKAPAADAIAGWSPDSAGWAADAQARSFHLPSDRAGGTGLHWFRYHNFVPKASDWEALAGGQKPNSPRPELITDFCGYNAFSSPHIPLEDPGLYWVGDLTINCHVDVKENKPDGEVVLDLNEGARSYRCHLELGTGRATLAYAEPHDSSDMGDEHKLATAETPFVGPGAHDISFANVDDRLCLWIDGRLVDFGTATQYAPYGGVLIQRPWDEDLVPVGVAARGADVTVSHLFLQRDIYYRCDFIRPGTKLSDSQPGPGDDPDFGEVHEYVGQMNVLESKVDNPTEWFREYEQHLASRMTGPGADYENVSFQFKMGKDEFFMMGDNSPRSKDSRLWSNARHALHRYAVPRLALVGKAFFIYWPHGIPFLNDGRGYPDGPDSIWNNSLTRPLFYNYEDEMGQAVVDQNYPKLRVPFYPNFGRMHRIR
jgi:signal peptidase I